MADIAGVANTISLIDISILGLTPAVAVGYVYQGTAQALVNAANNATSSQQNSNILDHATTATGVALINHQAPTK